MKEPYLSIDKVRYGGRRYAKTINAIYKSWKLQAPIIVCRVSTAVYIKQLAEKLRLKIPEPIIIDIKNKS